MNEAEIRFNAAIGQILSQRDQAQAQCAHLAGDLAMANHRIAELEAKVSAHDAEKPLSDAMDALK